MQVARMAHILREFPCTDFHQKTTRPGQTCELDGFASCKNTDRTGNPPPLQHSARFIFPRSVLLSDYPLIPALLHVEYSKKMPCQPSMSLAKVTLRQSLPIAPATVVYKVFIIFFDLLNSQVMSFSVAFCVSNFAVDCCRLLGTHSRHLQVRKVMMKRKSHRRNYSITKETR